MAEGTENEDRLDLDDDNYIEEMDDEVEKQIEDDGAGGGGNENGEDQHEDLRSEDSGKDQLLEVDREEDLRDLCESVDKIIEIKLMKNTDTGEGKGFAFVAFKAKEVAQQAIEELHNREFKGRTLRCSLSEAKHRLFIGNVPKTWTDDEFRKVIEVTGPGAENIELIKDPQNPSQNRGFAFVEYYNNACADYSRQKMLSANFKMDGNAPTVSWADPKNVPDNSAAVSQSIFLQCEQVKRLFQRHGEVSKVVMPPAKSGGKRSFGFVHYAERSSALKAVEDAEKYEIDAMVHLYLVELEVCLAKPQSDKKFDWTNPYISGPHPNYTPHPGYGGFPGNPYGSLGGGYGAATGFQQAALSLMSLSQPCKNDWSNSSSRTSGPMATVADGIDPTRV
ncbi:Heterogeneous nuclear ribonucleoprotein Q [Camellia lanceoleosa]|uniref:Heterogeneous nuclear ribonucleoprotein Q n=1 Tax=Camellia lanceoleosa TaxID=1840588 RepID=A0ACC0IMX8_9ERIC|nr:Heterogeneous nuclear ribonucleoprotein Q [Camellia lanceoleosa]